MGIRGNGGDVALASRRVGARETKKITNNQCPMPNAQCPTNILYF
ncbi:hypothetical protein [Nostoc sp.]